MKLEEGAIRAAIDARIKELGDWRGETLARVRASSSRRPIPRSSRSGSGEASRSGTHDGIICTGETYKNVVKLTFVKGASLEDPAKLFNSSLEGNTRRAIDIPEGEKVNAAAFKALIRAAVALNKS